VGCRGTRFCGWRNSTHARVVVCLPTLVDVIGANATFVVGSRARTVDSVASVYARMAFSPAITYTRPGRFNYQPIFAFLDSERWFAQFRWSYVNRSYSLLPLQYPGVVVSVGGPGVNSLTYALNPPGRVGAGGLPFYFDPSVGGVRDARSGAVW